LRAARRRNDNIDIGNFETMPRQTLSPVLDRQIDCPSKKERFATRIERAPFLYQQPKAAFRHLACANDMIDRRARSSSEIISHQFHRRALD